MRCHKFNFIGSFGSLSFLRGTGTSCQVPIQISISGGTPTYDYIVYDDSQTVVEGIYSSGANPSFTVDGSVPAVYTIQVTDANNYTTVSCGLTYTPLTATFAQTSAQNCTVTLTGTVTGGVPFSGSPSYYLYSIYDETDSQTVVFNEEVNVRSNLTYTANISGSYVLSVLDSNGCIYSTNPVDLSFVSISAELSALASCSTNITVDIIGGISPYSYVLTNENTTGTITGSNITDTNFVIHITSNGNYSITVTDANGCATTSNTIFQIIDSSGITITAITSAQIECSVPLTVSATGGTGEYMIEVIDGNQYDSNSIELFGLQSYEFDVSSTGIYTIIVTDTNSCQTSTTIPVTIVPIINLTYAQLECTGTLTAHIPCSTPILGYEWISLSEVTIDAIGPTLPVTTNDSYYAIGGYYDANGHLAFVNSNTVVVTTILSSVTIDVGVGMLTAVTTGGVPTLSYLWSNGETTQTIHVHESATYGVTVTDMADCSKSASITVGPDCHTHLHARYILFNSSYHHYHWRNSSLLLHYNQ